MTAHRRRAFSLRAGVVAAFALGTVAAIGTPALAAATVTATAVTLEVGGDQKAVTVNVTADTDPLNGVSIAADSLPSGVSCSSGCGSTFNVSAGQTVPRIIYLKANSTTAEGTSTGTVRIEPSAPPVKADFQIAVKPKPPTTVIEIAGTVKDSTTGEKLSDVTVVMADGSGKTYSDTTDGTGVFSFKTGGSTQIQAGTIRIAVSKDGFSAPMKSYTVAAGAKKTDISIAMTPKNAPTPTAQPSMVEETPLESIDPNAGASLDASQAADGGTDLSSGSGDSGGLSWMMIIIGGLLVLLGIGAIALILMRRNNDEDDEDDDEDDVPVRRPQGPRVTTGYYGARPSTDPTMVARAPMAESPTSVQRPGEYGGRPTGGWTGYGQDAQPTQYGGGGTYGSPAAPTSGYAGGGAYGAAGGGYGSPAAPTSGYAGGAGAYGAQSGYGSPAAPTSSAQGYGQASGPAYGQASGAGAYGQANGYGQQQPGYGGQPANGYGGQPPANGYGAQGGYDQSGYGGQPGYGAAQSGYDQAGGYSAQAGYGSQGGYDQSAGGYGGQAGYGEQANGYGVQGGYEQGYGQQQGGGYGGQPGGYVPEQRSGGYDQGAYDQSTQRWSGSDSHAQQSGGYDDQSRRADRRLDWLDD